ncbi:MAP6 domain-containing protein 1-like [Choloepus didactylus]|uniref:MAP6 domain-containing protein 1-like n=1 Tax=Choloepus didactylus TaxID=27675 RepID=UPI00189D0E9D|nr:MAP6 domain-containing protein 1-like [Choloepus didactylus]
MTLHQPPLLPGASEPTGSLRPDDAADPAHYSHLENEELSLGIAWCGDLAPAGARDHGQDVPLTQYQRGMCVVLAGPRDAP